MVSLQSLSHPGSQTWHYTFRQLIIILTLIKYQRLTNFIISPHAFIYQLTTLSINKQTLFLYPLDSPLTIVILRLTFAIIAGVLHHYLFLPLHPQHGLQSCQPTSLSAISTQTLASYISSHSAGYRWASQPVHSILNLVASTSHHPSSQTISLFWGFTPALDSYAGLPSFQAGSPLHDIASFFPCQPPSGNIKKCRLHDKSSPAMPAELLQEWYDILLFTANARLLQLTTRPLSFLRPSLNQIITHSEQQANRFPIH